MLKWGEGILCKKACCLESTFHRNEATFRRNFSIFSLFFFRRSHRAHSNAHLAKAHVKVVHSGRMRILNDKTMHNVVLLVVIGARWRCSEQKTHSLCQTLTPYCIELYCVSKRIVFCFVSKN